MPKTKVLCLCSCLTLFLLEFVVLSLLLGLLLFRFWEFLPHESESVVMVRKWKLFQLGTIKLLKHYNFCNKTFHFSFSCRTFDTFWTVTFYIFSIQQTHLFKVTCNYNRTPFWATEGKGAQQCYLNHNLANKWLKPVTFLPLSIHWKVA